MSVIHCHNKDQFTTTLNGAGTKLVVVDFSAQWCGPCKRIAPEFEKLAGEKTNIVFAKVDVDENEEVARECGIECMPTFQFFKGGKKVFQFEGADLGQLKAKITELAA